MALVKLKGVILNPTENGDVEIIRNSNLEFSNSNGKISKISPLDNKEEKNLSDKIETIIIPGLIDLHSHIPQLPGVGKNADELLPWLKNHIFPLETKFNSLEYAEVVIRRFFEDALSCGTTTFVLYSSIHKEATNLSFEIAKEFGIRAFIGKVMMDRDMKRYPEPLPTMARNIKDSMELAKQWHGENGGLLHYIFTPRFAGSCSMKLLQKTAEIAKDGNFFIQSHLAENQSEVNFIKSLFEREKLKVPTNTHIFKKSNLLGERTLLAHCLYLSQIELQILESTGTNIIHCPTSNIFLQSGFMPFRRYQDHKINIGLGTDVAGGYSLSLFNEMRNAIETSKIVNVVSYARPKPILTAKEVFWISTLGAAKILKIDNEIGSLEPGKDADLVVIKPNKLFNFYCNLNSTEDILQSLIYLPHTYLIQEVYIRGRKIKINQK
ncbi:MAG: amidohydrolase family protein [Ignavibacteria bacterium]|nr:amidohydrolase family protein [Ignavibacteria bacterium]